MSLLIDIFESFHLNQPKDKSGDLYPSSFNLYACAQNTHNRFNMSYTKMISQELSLNSFSKLTNVVELFNRTIIFTLCVQFSSVMSPNESTTHFFQDVLNNLRPQNENSTSLENSVVSNSPDVLNPQSVSESSSTPENKELSLTLNSDVVSLEQIS